MTDRQPAAPFSRTPPCSQPFRSRTSAVGAPLPPLSLFNFLLDLGVLE